MPRRATWAVIVSILVGTIWLAGILLYWAFWSSGLDGFQNMIVALASLLVAGGIIGAAWVSTGLTMYPKYTKPESIGVGGKRMDEEEMVAPPWGVGRGMGWRIGLSIALFFSLIAFILVWLFFFAGGFNIYQNIAIGMVALLAFSGLGAAVWAPMWMRWERRW